jgi:hypothetical protein
MRYLTHVLSAEFGKMLEMVCSKKYKKLRWKCYMDNKRTVNQFCKEIVEYCIPEQTIVCFGDASFRHNSAGYASSPKQAQFVKELRKMNVKVHMTNEYNSSQVCSRCMKEKRLIGCETARKNKHFVRRCTEKSCRMIWNRDVNAAINMVTIGKIEIMSGDRPALFKTSLIKVRLGLQLQTRKPPGVKNTVHSGRMCDTIYHVTP